jgi:hypothetical protein
MTRYCDIHGAVEVPDGPPNQIFKCDRMLGTNVCNTLLTVLPRSHQPPEPRGPEGNADPRDPFGWRGDQPQAAPPHTRAKRHDTIMNQAAFLAAYGQLGSITEASKVADIDRKRHYEWLRDDTEYQAMFDESHRSAVQNLVDRAYARAMGNGVEASDRLMIKFLESIPKSMSPRGWEFNPAKRHELSGPGGGPIETTEVNARDVLESRITSLTTPTDPASGT